MAISQDFVNWITGIRLQSAQKHRTAKPGTIGAMSVKEFKEFMRRPLAKAAPGAQARALESNPLRSALKARAYVQFKTVGIPPMEHAEALKMLLGMTPAERQKLLDQLAAVERAAIEWGMPTGDIIELIKG